MRTQKLRELLAQLIEEDEKANEENEAEAETVNKTSTDQKTEKSKEESTPSENCWDDQGHTVNPSTCNNSNTSDSQREHLNTNILHCQPEEHASNRATQCNDDKDYLLARPIARLRAYAQSNDKPEMIAHGSSSDSIRDDLNSRDGESPDSKWVRIMDIMCKKNSLDSTRQSGRRWRVLV